MLEIDISGPNHEEEEEEDLMKIQFRNQDIVQVNFSKFLYRSSYLCEKCSEIMKSFEREIVEIGNKYNIQEEIVKEFLEIISKDKLFIPIEHFKDIYMLSRHFRMHKLTNLLSDMKSRLLINDLNFSIQIVIDQKEEDADIISDIEFILKTRVNECMKIDKFKELPIQTIYRIIESAILNDRESVDFNLLFDFIVESAMNRFILFRFIELHRLSKDKIDEFIKFIDEQNESSKQIYLEYIPFDFLFLKEMKNNNNELSNNFNQSQNESKQMKEELKQTKIELTDSKEELQQTKEKSKQMKEELKQTKIKLTETKVELQQIKKELEQFKDKYYHSISNPKQYAHTIIVGGRDNFNQFGKIQNKQYGNNSVIHPSQKSSIDPSSLLSFSTYCDHSVQVTKSGKLLGIGYNEDGRINDSLPKTKITNFTEFSIRDVSSSQLDPVSAVCCHFGTLYMFSSGSRRQLVLCDKDINDGHPVFLDIGDEYPVSLFGGHYHSAAISNKGEVIFINRSAVKNSPKSVIKSVSLPDGEKAVSVACCCNSVVVLSSNGRVFLSAVQPGSSVLNFSTVSELSGQEIVWVSGTLHHFLAVSREGRVFGRGSNEHGELGLNPKTKEVSSFTEILSLKGHTIKAAYAGCWHSLFITREGKILACGYNNHNELLLSSDSREKVYTPTETTITESATFCIAGDDLSTVFIGGDPPPNTPNRLIEIE